MKLSSEALFVLEGIFFKDLECVELKERLKQINQAKNNQTIGFTRQQTNTQPFPALFMHLGGKKNDCILFVSC